MFSQLRKYDQSVRNAVVGGPQPIRAACGINAETQSRLPIPPVGQLFERE
jgi:hypothetical protein